MKSIPLITSVMALIGVLIGAILSQYLIEKREKEIDFGRLRIQAYQEFFSTQADYKIAKVRGAEGGIKAADFLLYESRLQMGFVGSSATIGAIVSYWAEYYPAKKCNDSEMKYKDAKIYEQMRQETFEFYQQKADPIEIPNLVRFIFRCEF